jgi:hypothetical protein
MVAVAISTADRYCNGLSFIWTRSYPRCATVAARATRTAGPRSGYVASGTEGGSTLKAPPRVPGSNTQSRLLDETLVRRTSRDATDRHNTLNAIAATSVGIRAAANSPTGEIAAPKKAAQQRLTGRIRRVGDRRQATARDGAFDDRHFQRVGQVRHERGEIRDQRVVVKGRQHGGGKEQWFFRQTCEDRCNPPSLKAAVDDEAGQEDPPEQRALLWKASMPPCDHKRQLLDAYRAATTAFSSRLPLLNDRMGTSSRDEYERLRRQVDEARVSSEQARLALERHVPSTAAEQLPVTPHAAALIVLPAGF